MRRRCRPRARRFARGSTWPRHAAASRNRTASDSWERRPDTESGLLYRRRVRGIARRDRPHGSPVKVSALAAGAGGEPGKERTTRILRRRPWSRSSRAVVPSSSEDLASDSAACPTPSTTARGYDTFLVVRLSREKIVGRRGTPSARRRKSRNAIATRHEGQRQRHLGPRDDGTFGDHLLKDERGSRVLGHLGLQLGLRGGGRRRLGRRCQHGPIDSHPVVPHARDDLAWMGLVDLQRVAVVYDRAGHRRDDGPPEQPPNQPFARPSFTSTPHPSRFSIFPLPNPQASPLPIPNPQLFNTH